MGNTASIKANASGPSIWGWLIIVALWLAVVASALAVVRATHEARQLTNRLAKAETEAAELQVQRGQYLLERSAWGAYSRVESMASEKLNMALPAAEQIIVIEK